MNYVQIVEICCRDLRRYLEIALKTTHGGVVTVKMRRLLRAELSPPDRARYSMCLSNVLRQWRWKHGTYIIPRLDAEKLLETFDALCESAKNMKRRRPKPPPRPKTEPRRKEEMVLTTLLLPPPLLHVLDEYARERRMSRSAVIRYAIYLLISKYKGLHIEPIHEKPLERVSFHLPRDLLSSLDEYAAALQTSRASIVRYAVARMLRRIHNTQETTPVQVAP
jgi:metal-responsive CopG/Arc/MetJ family transcriptional regulator